MCPRAQSSGRQRQTWVELAGCDGVPFKLLVKPLSMLMEAVGADVNLPWTLSSGSFHLD